MTRILGLGALCALVAACAAGASPQAQDQFVYTFPQPLLKVALGVGVVATGLSVLGIATLVPVWRERTWPIGRRLRHCAAVALFVATIKGSLVGCYFMHLISEKKLIYAVLVLTAAFFVALLALPVFTHSNGFWIPQ